VHLIHSELHEELRAQGFNISPGRMGENITTRGIDLLNLPKGTRLHLGKVAIVEVTGLRNPCEQLDDYQDGLLKACVGKDAQGNIIRKAGIMSIVLVGGEVFPNDEIRIEYPPEPHVSMDVV
jgi:MOSC domain-containing protein YiiM